MRAEEQYRNTSHGIAKYIEKSCVGHAAVEDGDVVRSRRTEIDQALDCDSSIWSGGGSTGRRIVGTVSRASRKQGRGGAITAVLSVSIGA